MCQQIFEAFAATERASASTCCLRVYPFHQPVCCFLLIPCYHGYVKIHAVLISTQVLYLIFLHAVKKAQRFPQCNFGITWCLLPCFRHPVPSLLHSQHGEHFSSRKPPAVMCVFVQQLRKKTISNCPYILLNISGVHMLKLLYNDNSVTSKVEKKSQIKKTPSSR